MRTKRGLWQIMIGAITVLIASGCARVPSLSSEDDQPDDGPVAVVADPDPEAGSDQPDSDLSPDDDQPDADDPDDDAAQSSPPDSRAAAAVTDWVLYGVLETDDEPSMSIDPNAPEGPWGRLAIDSIRATPRFGNVVAGPGRHVVVIDYHIVLATGEPTDLTSALSEESFRLIAPDGTVYGPRGSFRYNLRAGAVVNETLAFTLPNSVREFRLEAGEFDEDGQGFVAMVDVTLIEGALPDPIPPAAGPDVAAEEIILASDGDLFNTHFVVTDKPIQVEVLGAQAMGGIGPDRAKPGFRFVTVDIRATRVGGTRTPQVNVFESEFRVLAASEWYGPTNRLVEGLFLDDVLETQLVFELPVDANELRLEIGPHTWWPVEPGRTVEYDIILAG